MSITNGQGGCPACGSHETMPSLMEDKARLRQMLRSRRKAIAPNHAAAAAASLSIGLSQWLAGPQGSLAGRVIAGYWPTGSELDIRPTLAMLVSLGATIVLPVVTSGAPLSFRRWTPGMDLDAGNGCQHPPASAETLTPDLLLVPLLGFDAGGNRLGQGGGYYDRTLAQLRAEEGGMFAIGIAYACQEVENLPTGPNDQPMDAIATEAGLWVTADDDDEEGDS